MCKPDLTVGWGHSHPNPFTGVSNDSPPRCDCHMPCGSCRTSARSDTLGFARSLLPAWPWRSGFEWLAQSRAGWLAASLLLGVALLSMALAGSSAAARASDWVQMLAPADDVGRAITVSDSPPAIGALLARTPGGA